MELSPALENIINQLNEQHGDAVEEVYQSSGDTFVRVSTDQLIDVLKYLKNELHFIYLVDVFGIDRYTNEDRFEVVYNLMSLREQVRLFVKARCSEEDPHLPSATAVWKAAGWNEREVYDMFGIRFDNHPDMRRIYMPQDFQYYPLRKEFPLLGIPGSIELPSSTPDTE